MTISKVVGNRGEDLACEFLEKQGYESLQRNWASGKGVHCVGEIDIVAEKDEVLAFVEVKSRMNSAKDSEDFAPEHSFDEKKQRKMRMTIDAYLKANNYLGHISISLIAINFDKEGGHTLRFYENMRIF